MPFRLTRPLRVVIATAGAALLAVWGGLRWDAAMEAEQWRHLRRQSVAQQLAAAEIPHRADAYIRRAEIRAEEVFPPDRQGVREDLAQALALAPLRSEIWFALSRNMILSGRPEEGRAALLRAEELDPAYPRQRLRAAQLWMLLGERDRAREVAQQVAAFAPALRGEAARELAIMGILPEQVFELLGGSELPPPEMGHLVAALPRRSPGGFDELFRRVPSGAFEDPEFRRIVWPVVRQPLMLDVVTRLWRADLPPGAIFDEQQRLGNPALVHPPFSHRLDIGWMLPSGPVPAVSWLSPRDMELDHGVLDVRVPRGHDDPIRLQYSFYRVPLEAAASSVYTIRIRGNALRPGNQVWLTAMSGANRFRGEHIELGQEWRQLSVSVPALDETALFDLVLEGRFPANAGYDPELYIGALLVNREEQP